MTEYFSTATPMNFVSNMRLRSFPQTQRDGSTQALIITAVILSTPSSNVLVSIDMVKDSAHDKPYSTMYEERIEGGCKTVHTYVFTQKFP